MVEFEEPLEDDVAMTPEDLDTDIPADGFTIKGKVFQVESSTTFYNDEDVPLSWDVYTEDGDPIGVGFDNTSWPETPTLAEAIYALIEEEALDGAIFTNAERKALYESLIRRQTRLIERDSVCINQQQDTLALLKDKLEAVGPADFADELRAKFAGG